MGLAGGSLFRSSTPPVGAVGTAGAGGVLLGAAALVGLSEEAAAEGAAVVMGVAVDGEATDTVGAAVVVEAAAAGVAAGAGAATLISWTILNDCFLLINNNKKSLFNKQYF